MKSANPPLPLGYSPVPEGKLANVVTCLEMLEKPPSKPGPALAAPYAIERWAAPDLAEYRDLFRRVGEDWMWVSRLLMDDAELTRALADPGVDICVVRSAGRSVGLLELDFREQGACELALFGLTRETIGHGVGRALMNHAIEAAWARPITRFWLHTCHFDHPGAVAFYQRSGFRPYAFMVEVTDDPRLTGQMRRTSAPHVPLIGAD
jgi:GNAT superfamily N-acetyltransferase